MSQSKPGGHSLGPKKKKGGAAPLPGKQSRSWPALADVHIDVFIQSCIIWPTLIAGEATLVSSLAGAIATWNKMEILLETKKGIVGEQMTVSATVAKLQAYGWLKRKALSLKGQKRGKLK